MTEIPGGQLAPSREAIEISMLKVLRVRYPGRPITVEWDKGELREQARREIPALRKQAEQGIATIEAPRFGLPKR